MFTWTQDVTSLETNLKAAERDVGGLAGRNGGVVPRAESCENWTKFLSMTQVEATCPNLEQMTRADMHCAFIPLPAEKAKGARVAETVWELSGVALRAMEISVLLMGETSILVGGEECGCHQTE